jgi:fructokinase
VIICCGEALVDFLPRKSFEGADVYQPFNGGSIFNTAIALGRLGITTGYFGGLSKDFFGDMLAEGLKASNVDLKFVRRSDWPSTLAFVKLTDGHARYSFFDENSAGRMLTKKDLPALPAKVKALHFGSISLIPDPGGAALEALLTSASKTKVISLDPNIRPGFIKDRKKHVARLNRLIANCDILKISDEDVAWLTGSKDFAALAKKWLKAGARIVVITKGGEGVEAFTAQGSIAVPSVIVKVADTVGAGDTFTAGLLAHLTRLGLLDKKKLAGIAMDDLKAALEFAARAAAVTVSRPGADPPWAGELA